MRNYLNTSAPESYSYVLVSMKFTFPALSMNNCNLEKKNVIEIRQNCGKDVKFWSFYAFSWRHEVGTEFTTRAFSRARRDRSGEMRLVLEVHS
ncbi:unnamed protein product [Rotaria sp. Silwood2]|nr:unnamed protein product [Rotaria sp. Silwood2]